MTSTLRTNFTVQGNVETAFEKLTNIRALILHLENLVKHPERLLSVSDNEEGQELEYKIIGRSKNEGDCVYTVLQIDEENSTVKLRRSLSDRLYQLDLAVLPVNSRKSKLKLAITRNSPRPEVYRFMKYHIFATFVFFAVMVTLLLIGTIDLEFFFIIISILGIYFTLACLNIALRTICCLRGNGLYKGEVKIYSRRFSKNIHKLFED